MKIEFSALGREILVEVWDSAAMSFISLTLNSYEAEDALAQLQESIRQIRRQVEFEERHR